MVGSTLSQAYIKDNKGNLQLKAGEIADDVHLNTMMYYVEGIDATVPGT